MKSLSEYIYKLFGNNYWNTRYMLGGNSGYNGLDVDKYTNYVWSAIDKTAGKQKDVIDVGCGDLLFWSNRDSDKYIGIDISPKIININKKLRPKWKFISSSADASLNIKAETVICMNTLYHIMDDNVYNNIIKNIISWSDKWIMIITWRKIPKNLKKDSFYQKYRDFSIYKDRIVNSGFTLVLEEHIPLDDYGCLWIFKRRE